jgi:Raf kinase inhibitor-like YbhB/YbcL family protein
MFYRLILLMLAGLLSLVACSGTATPPVLATDEDLPTQEVEMSFELSTPAFQPGAPIPKEYTCRGRGVSPELNWGDPPAGTQSFALIMDDPDAPSGTFVHWVIFNIPGSSRALPAALPKQEKLADGATQGLMSARDHGYYGPCPPSGTHHYFFKLYALDALLELTSQAGAEDLTKAMQGHILAQTELVGIFTRE